jgi:hypothetical protein
MSLDNAVPGAWVSRFAGTVGISVCEAFLPSCEHEALFEDDGELCLRLEPLTRRPFPFGGGVIEDQI